MTSPDPLAGRAKRLLFRARHRGTRELDLLVGGFAAAALPGMESAGLDEFERIQLMLRLSGRLRKLHGD